MPAVYLLEILGDDERQYTEDTQDAEDDEKDDRVDFRETQKKIIAGGIILAILVPVLTVGWALSPFGRQA
jgi:hypothetical protein